VFRTKNTLPDVLTFRLVMVLSTIVCVRSDAELLAKNSRPRSRRRARVGHAPEVVPLDREGPPRAVPPLAFDAVQRRPGVVESAVASTSAYRISTDAISAPRRLTHYGPGRRCTASTPTGAPPRRPLDPAERLPGVTHTGTVGAIEVDCFLQ